MRINEITNFLDNLTRISDVDLYSVRLAIIIHIIDFIHES